MISEVFHILFYLTKSLTPGMHFMLTSPSWFGFTTFQVLSRYVWLVALCWMVQGHL